jgi:hypothetical protein
MIRKSQKPFRRSLRELERPTFESLKVGKTDRAGAARAGTRLEEFWLLLIPQKSLASARAAGGETAVPVLES